MKPILKYLAVPFLSLYAAGCSSPENLVLVYGNPRNDDSCKITQSCRSRNALFSDGENEYLVKDFESDGLFPNDSDGLVDYVDIYSKSSVDFLWNNRLPNKKEYSPEFTLLLHSKLSNVFLENLNKIDAGYGKDGTDIAL